MVCGAAERLVRVPARVPLPPDRRGIWGRKPLRPLDVLRQR